MRYEPPAINFHLRETLPREPQGGGEYTECAATILRPVEWIKARGLADCLRWPQPA